jgi:hypothetical protein
VLLGMHDHLDETFSRAILLSRLCNRNGSEAPSDIACWEGTPGVCGSVRDLMLVIPISVYVEAA